MVGESFHRYLDSVTNLITRQAEAAEEELEELTCWMVEAVRGDRRIFVFGAGHSSLMASELFYRTGGLALVNPVTVPGLGVDARPIDAATAAERVEGYAPLWLEAADPRPAEVLIVISVSGRNPAGIDMAVRAGDLGLKVAAVTSLPYSSSVPSRHSSGKRLYEVVPLVIDIGGERGDALVEIPGGFGKVGPSSTVVGTALLNAVVCEAVRRLADEDGSSPPVFMSANLPGGDEHNRRLLSRYRHLLTYI